MSVRIIGANKYGEANVLRSANTTQSLIVSPYDSNGQPAVSAYTYDVGITAFTPGATPQDVVSIMSNGIKIISITRFRLATTQTTSGINSWYLIKRSTPNYAGTFTYQTPVSRWYGMSISNIGPQPPATAIVQAFTANPSVAGVSMGFIRSGKVLAAASPGTITDQGIWDFDDFQSNPIVLRGYGQMLALNFNGAALPPGLSVNVSLTWTEE